MKCRETETPQPSPAQAGWQAGLGWAGLAGLGSQPGLGWIFKFFKFFFMLLIKNIKNFKNLRTELVSVLNVF